MRELTPETITDAVLKMESTAKDDRPLLLVRAEARIAAAPATFVPGVVPQQRETRVGED